MKFSKMLLFIGILLCIIGIFGCIFSAIFVVYNSDTNDLCSTALIFIMTTLIITSVNLVQLCSMTTIIKRNKNKDDLAIGEMYTYHLTDNDDDTNDECVD